tara:strand:+ start:1424 stop:3802 length:2379 start_codon:yes stop_codon:yes gene_type:complete
VVSAPAQFRKPNRASAAGISLLMLIFIASGVSAAIYTLKNNVQIEGEPGKIGGIGESPLASGTTAGEVSNKLVHFADDGIRRTFFSQYQVLNFVNSPSGSLERIMLKQRVATVGKRLVAVGPILNITTFDDFGRRTVTMKDARGPLHLVQGVTEVNSKYIKLETLFTKTPIIWETRLATSSMPTPILGKILKTHLDMKNPDDRLKIVRLYMQCERYREAMFELQSAIEQFPELANLKEQISQLRQALADRLIEEIENRQRAGQHSRVYAWLENFPSDGVAVETLLRARDLLKDYDEQSKQRDIVFAMFDKYASPLEEQETIEAVAKIRKEIFSELNINTLPRFADFVRLGEDPEIGFDQKLAMAISGWLMGQGEVTQNLAVAISLFDVRNAIREYLTSDNTEQRREILDHIAGLEGGTPTNIARLLNAMKPSIPLEQQAHEDPLHFTYETTGADDKIFRYVVQLPPDYDAYRKYPTIVSLHGAGNSPEQQIDWWAGSYNKQMDMRLGQASRHGYIVIAPEWTEDQYQASYQYSAQEHSRVLYALQESLHRFAIDTDRIFLSGHSVGGDAAWDIGLAHPDLWAGVLPVCATAGKYVTRYWKNAKHVSFYFVSGEMDGNRIAQNERDFNRYLNRSGFDTMIVEYKGRGHDHFQDDIHHMFSWMRFHRREFSVPEYNVTTLRPWDNYFWWAEFTDFPPETVTLPLEWPPTTTRTMEIEASVSPNNRIRIKSAAARISVFLTPDLVDFEKNVTLNVIGRERIVPVTASAEVMLEDVRLRGDRQHPFWARFDFSRAQ